MKVIVTHENTDFDGFSALVAAARLFPSAVPVVPHKMNRNVRDFYELYQDELPLCSPTDLPKERIDSVIIVDSQTPPRLRGIHDGTDYTIIDHHGMDEPLPNAAYELDTVGAVTTVLVERLLRADLSLDPLEATLFMVGIYEDTGNLAYDTTTPRDLLAAASLLERGGNLSVVDRFLRYPLTVEQRELYNRLLQSVETIGVEGISVAICFAVADQYVDEVSVLAHRLGDLYEPDVLFLLVQMMDHVQIVARSGSGSIDVGRVARHFGGGGHNRAAAALVRERPLEEVLSELVSFLPMAVEPTKTVRHIMSYGVHALAPGTRVEEAAALMQRYGHEGFPVVDGQTLVGTITRREIDRAMHHGLDRAPVRAYMRAEDLSVTPDTGIRELQRLMTEHSIGQVPVVEEGRVIGIVTRTDLIKLWAERDDSRDTPRVGQLLEKALPAPLWELVQAAAEAAHEMGYELYAVGGFVRDLLLGYPNLDLDLVVEGDAIRLARRLSDGHGGEVRSHRRFGTAKWLLGDIWRRRGLDGEAGLPEHVDFATARTEFYERPSALPVVERSSIKQDLQRRDFTINTLAVSLSPERLGEVLDFFGGLKDLDRGLVRVLHSLSFVEDPTRILRAVRLEARLGFRIEGRTADLMADALELLRRTSGERVAHELLLILEGDQPERAVARLHELQVLPQISPALALAGEARVLEAMRAVRELAPEWSVEAAQIPAAYLCLMAWQATSGEIEALVSRLRLPRRVARHLRDIPGVREAAEALARAEMAPSEVHRLLGRFELPVLLAAYALAAEGPAKDRLCRYQREWRHVRPRLTGRDLQKWGLDPGPLYGRILQALRAAVLDSAARTREEEEQLVRRWIEEGRFGPVPEGHRG